MPGGSETYLETVAPELIQLGHDVIAYAPVLGTVAQRLRQAGIEVTDDLNGLSPDVIHAQQASTAMRVRGHFPTTPMVYVCHSSVLDIEDPPVASNPQAIVTLADVVDRRVRATALGQAVPVHRLTQPVETPFIDPLRRQLPPNPRTAVLVSHRAGWIQNEIEKTCSAMGIELNVLGQAENRPDNPIPEMMKGDVVFAVGRTLLEAMSMGRAAFIADDRGLWGFVTADNYTDAESYSFARLSERPTAPLAELLAAYDQSLGDEMVRLSRAHHSSRIHASRLVDVYAAAMTKVAPIGSSAAYDACADTLEKCFTMGFATRDAKWQVAAIEYELDVTRIDYEARLAHEITIRDERMADLERQVAETTGERDALRAELDAWRETRIVKTLGPLRSMYAKLRSHPH